MYSVSTRSDYLSQMLAAKWRRITATGIAHIITAFPAPETKSDARSSRSSSHTSFIMIHVLFSPMSYNLPALFTVTAAILAGYSVSSRPRLGVR